MRYSFLIIFSFFSICSIGQTTFQKIFYGQEVNKFFNVIQTSEGGYLIGGVTKNYGQGDDDIYLVRTDGLGDILWTKTYGSSTQDFLYSLDPTSDGGYIIGGTISGHPSLLKMDSDGFIIWTKSYSYGAFAAHPCNDGGYALFGTGLNGLTITKTDYLGNIIWIKSYGPNVTLNNHFGSGFKQTSDNGFIFTGYAYNTLSGGPNAILVKTNDTGNILWAKSYGGDSHDEGVSVLQLSDGGFLLSGLSTSFGIFGDYVIRTTSTGDTIWTRSFEFADAAWLEQTNNNSEFIITGGNGAACIIKFDLNGDTLWTQRYSLSNGEQGNCIRSTHDGGFIIAGSTFLFGHLDSYLIKTDDNGNSACNQEQPLYNVLRTQTQVTNIQLSYSIISNPIFATSLTMSTGSMDTTLCLHDNIFEPHFSAGVIFSPNPFQNTARFEIKNSELKINGSLLKIYNSMGCLMREEKISNLNSYILHRDGLCDGFYFYELRSLNSEQMSSGKFIVE